jgi:hypothetical protein
MIDTDGLDDLLREGMAEYTRDVAITPGSAGRALHGARRTRRVRLAATATLALGLVTLPVAASHLLNDPHRALVDVRPAVPSPQTRTPTPAANCGGSLKLPSTVPAGSVTVISTDPDGRQQLMWVNSDAELFLGNRVGDHGRLIPESSNPMNELNCRPAIFSTSSSAGPGDQSTPVSTLLSGAVRGRPTRILVHLPGGDVPAHLVKAPGELGTLFWLTTRAFTGDGRVADPKAARSFGNGTDESLKITVYDGQRVRLRCTLAKC